MLNRKTRKNRAEMEENEETQIYPEILVKVEVAEIDENETITPPEFVEVSKPSEPAMKPKQPNRKRKRKKVQKTEPACLPIQPAQKKRKRRTPFTCETCGQEFSFKCNMIRHQAVHVTREFGCRYCRGLFATQASLDEHLIAKHDSLINGKREKKSKAKATKNQNALSKTDPNSNDSNTKSTEQDVKTITSKSECDMTLQNAIVYKMHKGVMISEICTLYHITPEVVNEIWSDRDQFTLPKTAPRRNIKYINSVLEPLVLEWYNVEKTKNDRITGKLIQNVAEKIAREKGLVHFTAHSKWLEQFKKRYNIYFNTRKRDYSNVPTDSIWKIKFFEEQWSEVRKQFTDDEIYIADEVGLFYKPSKNRERKFAGRKFVQGDPVDRLSIFLCSNISGLDKRKLMVSGVEDPLRNSCRSPKTLPVTYYRHPEAQITTFMFEEYIKHWNDDLEKTDKKAVLILDRASIHSKLKLSHLKLQFLPWKGATGIMPIKSVYKRFRSEFRNLCLKYKAMNVIRGFDRNITPLEGLEMLEKSWERTPRSVITKSCMDLGYEVHNFDDNDNSIDEDDEGAQRICEFLKDYDVEPYYTDVNSLDLYLTVDQAFVVAKGTNPTLFGGNHKNTEPVKVEDETLPLNTNRPASNKKEEVLKETNAFADLEAERTYLFSNDTSFETSCNILDIETEVMEHFVKFNS